MNYPLRRFSLEETLVKVEMILNQRCFICFWQKCWFFCNITLIEKIGIGNIDKSMWPASTWKASANIEHLPLHSICSQNILWSLLEHTKQTFSEWNLCIFCMFNNSLGEKGDPIKCLTSWTISTKSRLALTSWPELDCWAGLLGLGQPLCLIKLFKPWWKTADLDV